MATDWIVLAIKVDKRMKYGLKDSAICLICNVLKDCTPNVIIHPFICSPLIDWQGRQRGPSQKTYLNDQNSYRKKLYILYRTGKVCAIPRSSVSLVHSKLNPRWTETCRV